MAANRRQYRETFFIKNADGTVSPLQGILVTPYAVAEDGTRAGAALPAAQIYNDRVAATHPASMQTDANGQINFWLDPGEYDLQISDTQGPARIATTWVGFGSISGNAQGITANQLPTYGQALLPTGALIPFAGPGGADPAGFLLCDGRVVSQATYAALYAVIGATYNTGGEGGGNFRIPDMRGRVPVGADSMGTAAAAAGRITANSARGNAGGIENHPLTVAQMPSHNHTATTSVANNVTGVSVNGTGTHRHTSSGDTGNLLTSYTGSGPNLLSNDATQTVVGLVNSAIGYNWTGPKQADPNTGYSGAHGHSITDAGHNHTATTAVDPNGSGAAHPNMQPFQVHNYIIKT